jgi:hypothetical protein
MFLCTENIETVCATSTDSHLIQNIWCQAYSCVLGFPYTGMFVQLLSLQFEAKQARFPKLSVSRSNPAFTLYQGLGFELVKEDDTHYHIKLALTKFQAGRDLCVPL